MASRVFTPVGRMLSSNVTPISTTTRTFQSSSRRFADATPLPVSKPVGAFRGGLYGFLLGTSLTGAGVYFYVLDEYKVSNELLTEDIYTLQAAVQRTHDYVHTLEEKMDALERKK